MRRRGYAQDAVGFGFVSEERRREADLFYGDLMGAPSNRGRGAEAESIAAEDATEDRVRTDIRSKAVDRARTRSTFLSPSDVSTALGAGVTAATTQALDAAVARAAPLRRQADADPPGTAQLPAYWTLVDDGAQRVLDVLERTRFGCSTASGALLVDGAVVDGMRATWTRSGEALSLSGLCHAAPPLCQPPHDVLHTPTGTGSLAAHFTGLDMGPIRTVQIAGLLGVDLRAAPAAQRPITAVKDLATNAPLQRLSFVAMRRGTQRDVHVAQQSPRVVESWVDGARWQCLPFMPGMAPGTGYQLFKTRFWEASLTRQWGTQDTLAWIVGLANFYRDRTGGLIGIGDISHVVGEEITDHASHRVGKDLDCYVLDPPAAGGLPGAFWCSGTQAALELRDLTTPSATAAQPTYTLASGAAAIADPRRAALLDRYATILAYCVATQNLLTAAVWHGATAMSARAATLAQNAWDATVQAGAGTTAQPGWRASWGPGPRDRAALTAPSSALFIGAGAPSYGAGWPPHPDHIHVRLR